MHKTDIVSNVVSVCILKLSNQIFIQFIYLFIQTIICLIFKYYLQFPLKFYNKKKWFP